MATILVTTMPFAGHVRPGLPLARELVARGHDVVWYTGRKYASLVTATGAAFVPFPPSSTSTMPTSTPGAGWTARPRRSVPRPRRG